MKEFIKKNWKIILIVCLGLALYFSVSASIQNRKKYLREKNNTEALLTDIEHERTKHGEDVATIHELQLTVKELKKLREEDVKMIEELKIRPPQIKEIVKTVVETKIEYRDTLIQTAPGKFEWKKATQWWIVDQDIDFTGNPPVVDFKISVRDSLSHVLYKVPKFKILGIRFGTKRYEIKCINHNPESNIVYNEWINVSRNKAKRNRN
jgi:hypothetical protein